MNSSLIKYKDLALKVIYYTKKRQLGSKIFFATSKFQEVLEYFDKNLKDPQTFLKTSYFLNGKQIYPSDILLYFSTVDPTLRLVEEDMYLEIEELDHLDDASEPIYETILKPVISPFKLIIINVKEGVLQQVDFPQEKVIEYGLDSLNNNYACCNSTDSLYLSCGKNMWIISHKTFQIERKEMPFSKENHSMTYILSNNTIFIAGGSEDSFYYDINTKEFITWGKMNGMQQKPALIQFGDFLYSFNSYSPKGVYFEKTKLTSPAKKWEKIVPQSGDPESGFFYNKLYGVSKCSGGNILFAGGTNNQMRTFIYNLKQNFLLINYNKDESIELSERNFYKIDHNFNIAIPADIEKDHIIALLNKNSKTLHLLPFEQIGFNTRNNLIKFDNPRDRLPGNLVIQCRYMTPKDYEIFLKQSEAEEKNKEKGGFGLYNRKEGKKFGDNLSGGYRYQYRGRTPALERINEGKSDEDSADEDIVKNKSSSAKKEKTTLDLRLNLENFGKLNLSKIKIEKDKKDENQNKKDNVFNQNVNNIKIQKDENEDKINLNINNNLSDNNDLNNNEVDKKEKDELINNEKSLEPKDNIILEEKNKDNIDAIQKEEKEDKVYNAEIDKALENNEINEVNNEHLSINIDRKKEGENRELNPSEKSSIQISNINSNNNISENNNIINKTEMINKNKNINNNLYKINKDINIYNNNIIKNNIKNRLKAGNNSDNINCRTNINNNKDEIKDNELKMNNVFQNYKRDLANNKNINTNYIIINNNNQQNKNINNNIMINDQKNLSGYQKNNIQNIKNNQNPKERKIHKSNTTFIIKQKNYKTVNNNTYLSNPFIDNDKYNNIVEKDLYNFRDDSEPNANKILTDKGIKFIREIKKSQRKKKYKTKTVNIASTNSQGVITQSISNSNSNKNIIPINTNNNNSSTNLEINSYKTSTHKQSKGKKFITLSHNHFDKKNMNSNDNLNFPENSKKRSIKSQINSQKINIYQTEENKRVPNYGGMFMKINKYQIISNQMINIPNNNIGKYPLDNRTRKINFGVSANNQINLSNDRKVKGNNNTRDINNMIITKDGKRYVLSKNVQRIRREDDQMKTYSYANSLNNRYYDLGNK